MATPLLKRGNIYYIFRSFAEIGSEQHAGRPGIVVSNDSCNNSSEVVEVVFLTTAPKNDLPTHVIIRSTSKISTALCEQVTSVDTCRLGDLIGTCTAAEMDAIDQALAISLDIPEYSTASDSSLVKQLEKTVAELKEERDRYKKAYENNIFKKLYETLLQEHIVKET